MDHCRERSSDSAGDAAGWSGDSTSPWKYESYTGWELSRYCIKNFPPPFETNSPPAVSNPPSPLESREIPEMFENMKKKEHPWDAYTFSITTDGLCNWYSAYWLLLNNMHLAPHALTASVRRRILHSSTRASVLRVFSSELLIFWALDGLRSRWLRLLG